MQKIKPAIFLTSLSVWIVLSAFFITSSEAQKTASDAPGAGQEYIGDYPIKIEDDFNVALQPWKGDYDGMVQRKMVRILVPYSRTHFFLDGASKRGIVAAFGRKLEQEINRIEGLRTQLVHVVFIPVLRSQLIPWLTRGLGDIAAGNLTITESHQMLVDFSEPVYRNSEELVVTGPVSPPINVIEDLAGKEVFIQSSSSYRQSLERISQTFLEKGLSPIEIKPLDEVLEVDGILEMVQAGLIPITVIDRHLVQFWSQVFTDLTVHSEIILAVNRDIGWAFRKESPKLKEVLNKFLTPRRHRTTIGNIIFRRYMQNVNWVKNVNGTADRDRFNQTIPLFRKFGEAYDLDPLLLAALGYQESRLDQSIRSPAGAIGVMQLLPSTGDSMTVGDITQLEPNIHAGTKYLRYLIDDRISGPEIDRKNKILLALASYNGGHTRIRRLRREAADMGLNPNVWFHNVELVSAREIGRENVQYVRNIYRYYLTYRRVEAKRAQRAARATDRQP